MINSKYLIYSSVILLLCLLSCNNRESALKSSHLANQKLKTRDELKQSIKYMEDSIVGLLKNPKTASKIPSLTHIELINRLKNYYRGFPSDIYSAECLFKIHVKYSDLNALKNSVAYGDTLLTNFPTFSNRDFLLESIGSSYDVGIEPRDTAMVRKYYTLLLKETKLTPEKRQDIQMRLKFIKLNFMEYAEFRAKQAIKSK